MSRVLKAVCECVYMCLRVLQVISDSLMSSGPDTLPHGHSEMQDAAGELYVNRTMLNTLKLIIFH